MKKDRPGTLLAVICRPQERERLEGILFSETATFGIRRHLVERSKRLRASCEVETPWGSVTGKVGRFGTSLVFTPEFDPCAKIAAQFAVPLRDVYRAAEFAFEQIKDEFGGDLIPTRSASEGVHLPSATHAAHGQKHDHDHSHDHSHSQDRDHSHDDHHDHDHGDHDHGHDHHH